MQVNFNRCMHRMESQLLLLLGKITQVATFGVLMRTGGRQSDLATKRVGTDFRPGHPMVRRSLFSTAIPTTCMSAVEGTVGRCLYCQAWEGQAVCLPTMYVWRVSMPLLRMESSSEELC